MVSKDKIIIEISLLTEIIGLIDKSRYSIAKTVNQELTLLYWNIGNTINNDILNNNRADYGKKIILELSTELSLRYGSGFSKRNIHSFIKFNNVIKDYTIVQTVSAQLSWSHLHAVLNIENETKRSFYIQMAIHEKWSVRVLNERIDSMLFERTAISKKPEKTIKKELKLLESEKKISPDLIFKDPYFLDFLGLHDTFSEKDLESSILLQLQLFITEMGTEFAFLARQKRITIDNEDFYIDLLYYHRGLKSLIVIELKLGKFKASYKGQMELYLRWLEKNEQKEGENKPIGLILCSEKSPEQLKYLMLDNNNQIKIAEYSTNLPEKNILIEKLQRAIAIAENEMKEIIQKLLLYTKPYKNHFFLNVTFNDFYSFFGTLSYITLLPMLN